MKTNRGAFLIAAAAGAALVAGREGAEAAAATVTYDRTRVNAILDRPAKHRIAIGAPRINEGACLKSSSHIIAGYRFAFGEGPGTTNVIVALYGPSSVMLVMNDAFWANSKAYELCTALNDLPATVVHGPRNPFYHARSTLNLKDDPSDDKGFWHDYTVEAVTKRGVSWFVCTEALHTASRQLTQLGMGSPEANFALMRKSLLPGALIVPSGSQSLIVAQERHYSYLAAN